MNLFLCSVLEKNFSVTAKMSVLRQAPPCARALGLNRKVAAMNRSTDAMARTWSSWRTAIVIQTASPVATMMAQQGIGIVSRALRGDPSSQQRILISQMARQVLAFVSWRLIPTRWFVLLTVLLVTVRMTALIIHPCAVATKPRPPPAAGTTPSFWTMIQKTSLQDATASFKNIWKVASVIHLVRRVAFTVNPPQSSIVFPVQTVLNSSRLSMDTIPMSPVRKRLACALVPTSANQ